MANGDEGYFLFENLEAGTYKLQAYSHSGDGIDDRHFWSKPQSVEVKCGDKVQTNFTVKALWYPNSCPILGADPCAGGIVGLTSEDLLSIAFLYASAEAFSAKVAARVGELAAPALQLELRKYLAHCVEENLEKWSWAYPHWEAVKHALETAVLEVEWENGIRTWDPVTGVEYSAWDICIRLKEPITGRQLVGWCFTTDDVFLFTAHCPVSLVVEDAVGKRFGYDAVSGHVFQEFAAEYLAGVDGPNILVKPALSSEYKLHVLGYDTGTYTLAVKTGQGQEQFLVVRSNASVVAGQADGFRFFPALESAVGPWMESASLVRPTPLHISRIQGTNTVDSLVLSYPVQTNCAYVIEYESQLGDTNGWQALPGNPNNSGGLSVTNFGEKGFFRLRVIELDVQPVLFAQLTNTVLSSSQSNITSNPVLVGRAIDLPASGALWAGFDNAPATNFLNVMTNVGLNGLFSFDRARLEDINGGPLADGFHTLHLRAFVAQTNLVKSFDFTIQIDTHPPTVYLSCAATDADTNSAGLQVPERSRLVLRAGAFDDVSVAKLELLQDGQVIGTAEQFPWQDFVVQAPAFSTNTSSVTFQARATDSAGNTNVSAPVVVEVLRDAVPPVVVSVSPTNGAILRNDLGQIFVYFSEPVDPATLEPSSVFLLAPGPGGVFSDGNDVQIPLTNFMMQAGERYLELDLPALGFGTYELRILANRLSDFAGNIMTNDFAFRFRVAGITTVVGCGDNDNGQANVPSGWSNVVAVAAGVYHSLALRTDGTVIGWGVNVNGQTNVPSGLSNVVAVAAGGYHSLALRADGTVVAWGYNDNGQANVPSGLSNVVAVAAGGYHSLALRVDGTAIGWGYNDNGEAKLPSGLNNVAAVAAGRFHSLALRADGTVITWGYNYFGQTNMPSGLSNVVAVAAGGYHSLALRADGTVIGWGDNYFGQTNVPSGLSNVVAVAAGGYHSLALRADGTVIGWGVNDNGQTNLPSGLSNVVAVTAGGYHSLAITEVRRLVYGEADLAVAALRINLSASPEPVAEGASLTYSLVVQNFGPARATGVRITDNLPPEVGFVSADSAHGACTFSNGTVICNIGSLGRAEEATITIVVPTGAPGAVTNAASVVGSEADPYMADNFATIAAAVVPAGTASLKLGMKAFPEPVVLFSNLTYTLIVGNAGPHAASGVVITNTLPLGVAFVGATSSQGACGFADGVVTCNIGDLGVASNATVAVVVTPTVLGQMTNLASVFGAEDDPNTNDNATATTSMVVFAPFDGSIVWDGDFNSLALGAAPSVNDPAGHWLFPADYVTGGVAETNVTEFTIVSAPDAPGSGNCLQLSTSSNPAGNQHLPNIFNRVLPALVGQTVIVSFDIYVYSGHGGGSVYVGYNGYGSDLNRGPQLSWTQTGNIIYTVGPVATNQVLVSGYPAGVWQRVWIVIDLPAARYDVYWGLRGGLLDKVGAGLEFRSGPLSALDRFTVARFDSLDTMDALSCFDNVAVAVQEPPTPTITTDPANLTRNAGFSAVFSVTAAGAPPLSYQWRKGGMDLRDGGRISGAQSPSLMLNSVLIGDAGGYSVVVTNANGSVTSQVATLTVLDPYILSQPLSQTAVPGQTVVFSVTAGRTLPLSYQWRKDEANVADGGAISGSQSPTLTFSNAIAADAGGYSVVIANASGSVTSQVATLTVLDPFIIEQPHDQSAMVGQTVLFSVTAGGTPPLGYQWRNGGVNVADGGAISGSQSPTVTLSNITAADAGGYSVVIANASGSVTSTVAALSIFGQAATDSFDPDADDTVYALTVQADGKILVGGQFYMLAGEPYPEIGRLNGDGTLDTTLNAQPSSYVSSLAMQTDGKILVGGDFNVLCGQWRDYIGRLNGDGSLDGTFNPGADSDVYSLAVQADGKILVGGDFNELGGQPCDYIGRLNANGTLDTTFNPGADYDVNSLAVQADGKILVGGGFNTLGGQPRHHLGRLNANGTLDSTFNPGADYDVYSLAVQADGKILVGGGFNALGGQPRHHLGRLNANGTLDSTFNPGADDEVDAVAVQADGKILVGGWFNQLGGQLRRCLGRLNADGTLDGAFDLEANNGVNSLAVQADGKILAVGWFTTLGGETRNYIGRLNNTELATESLAFDGSTITWLRGGASPEVWRTTFEASFGSTGWFSLGAGTRISGGWQLTGVSLPPGATIRARGFVTGGGSSGSGWFVETTRQFSP